MNTQYKLEQLGIKVHTTGVKAIDVVNNMYIAFRTCASNKTTEELIKELDVKTYEQKITFLNDNFNKKHLSLAEFGYIMFVIEGLPMYIGEQILRHRHLSFAKKSFRYVQIKENIVELKNIVENIAFTKEIHAKSDKYFYTSLEDNSINKSIYNVKTLIQYLEEIKASKPNEYARGSLPMSLRTSMAISGNIRAFMEISPKRTCKRSQGTNQLIFTRIKEIILEQIPQLSESLFNPNCGLCEDSCEFPSMK